MKYIENHNRPSPTSQPIPPTYYKSFSPVKELVDNPTDILSSLKPCYRDTLDAIIKFKAYINWNDYSQNILANHIGISVRHLRRILRLFERLNIVRTIYRHKQTLIYRVSSWLFEPNVRELLKGLLPSLAGLSLLLLQSVPMVAHPVPYSSQSEYVRLNIKSYLYNLITNNNRPTGTPRPYKKQYIYKKESKMIPPDKPSKVISSPPPKIVFKNAEEVWKETDSETRQRIITSSVLSKEDRMFMIRLNSRLSLKGCSEGFLRLLRDKLRVPTAQPAPSLTLGQNKETHKGEQGKPQIRDEIIESLLLSLEKNPQAIASFLQFNPDYKQVINDYLLRRGLRRNSAGAA